MVDHRRGRGSARSGPSGHPHRHDHRFGAKGGQIRPDPHRTGDHRPEVAANAPNRRSPGPPPVSMRPFRHRACRGDLDGPDRPTGRGPRTAGASGPDPDHIIIPCGHLQALTKTQPIVLKDRRAGEPEAHSGWRLTVRHQLPLGQCASLRPLAHRRKLNALHVANPHQPLEAGPPRSPPTGNL